MKGSDHSDTSLQALEPAVNALASALILGQATGQHGNTAMLRCRKRCQVFHPMVYASLLPVFAGVALASSKELSFTM